MREKYKNNIIKIKITKLKIIINYYINISKKIILINIFQNLLIN